MPLTIADQQDFAAGMQRDVSPHLIDQRGAYDIRNMILDEDGALRRRGGTAELTDPDKGLADGLNWIWSGQMSVGQRDVVASDADFGVVNGDAIVNLGSDGLANPVRPAYIAGLLFIPPGFIYGGSLKATSYSTGTVTATQGSKTVTGSGTAFTANVDPGMLFQVGNERVYVVASVDSNTQLTLRDAYEGTTGSGKSYTCHNILKVTTSHPYPISPHYTVAGNKLIWADGEKVRFTKDILSGGPHTSDLGEDYHELPDGGRVVGLASVGSTVLVFTTAGLFSILGIAYDIVNEATGSTQHRVDKVSEDLILFSDAGMTYWEQMLIAPCTNGVYLLDGVSSPIRLSKSIEPLWTRYAKGPYRCGNSVVADNHLFLPVIDNANVVQEFLVCRLDRQSTDRRRRIGFPWTRFSGHGGRLPSLALRVSSNLRQPKLLGADDRGLVVDCSGFTAPTDSNTTDADDTTFSWAIVTRDFTFDGMTLTLWRYLRLLYELGEGGEIKADWGDGLRVTSAPLWGQVKWGQFNWGGTEDSEFQELRRNDLPDTAPPDQGRNPHRWRVGKRRRRIRFRIRGHDPATCTIRSLELLTRAPGSRRR